MKHSHQIILEKKKVNVMILCGGFGSRISKVTKQTPKPLVKIFNKPFLYFLIKNLTRYNFDNFYLLTHYKNKDFIKFKKKYEGKIKTKISIVKEKTKLDTGGAVINALSKINNKNDFLLINGDTYLNADFNLIYDEFKKKNSLQMLLIKSSKESSKLNSMNINKKNKIYFSKKKLMNSGIYFFKKKNLKKFYKIKKCSFENFILKKKILSKQVRGIKSNNNFIDIGSYSSLKNLKKFMKNNYFNQKILFLDRDNTITYDKSYTYKIKDLKLINKNISFIKKKFQSYLKIIVTNQSGIGRGYFSEKNFKNFMAKLNNKLEKNNIYLSKIYYCPHHIDANKNNYKFNCNFRKPNTKMIINALKELEIKKGKNIFMIGNDIKDKKLALKSKIKYLDQEMIN